MKSALKIFLQPIANRHYTSNKASALLYAARFTPVVLLCVWGAFTISAVFWLVLAGIVAAGVVDYVLFDALFDKLSWKLFWGRLYRQDAPVSEEHRRMKELERKLGS